MRSARQWRWLTLLLTLFVGFVLTACGGGGGGGAPVPVAALGVSGSTLTFTAEEGTTTATTQNLTVSNTGDAESALEWSTMTSATSWLSLSGTTSGSLDQGASETFGVVVDPSGLASGDYNGSIVISATGLASRTITISLTISGLAVNPSALSYTMTEGSSGVPAQKVTVANGITNSVNWSATKAANWITISPASGTLAGDTGIEANLSINSNAATLSAGTHTDTVTFTPDGGLSAKTVAVTLTVNAATATATSGTAFVGGSISVTQLSSLVAASAVKAADAASSATILAEAKVTIKAIKPDGSYKTQSTVTDAKGGYSLELDVQAGDTLTITVEKTGYTTLNKTVKVKESDFVVQGDSRKFNVSGAMARATTIVVDKVENGIFKASGEPTPGFRFGLMRSADGSHTPFGSPAQARAAADNSGGIPDIEIGIPEAWAPGATALTAKLAPFNPFDQDERKMFPGEFVGVGGAVASRASDSGSYPLESVVFFESDIQPNNGVALAASQATGATAAADESAGTVIKWIPSEGCSAMSKYGDRDGNPDNGIQVPIYTYNPNSGQWGYLGEGTLKVWNNSTFLYDTVAAGTVIDGSDKLGNLACGSTDYYFEIAVTDWYDWWNLDYPILLAEPTTVCISGTVVDSLGEPISGAYIEADGYVNGGSSYYYSYSNDDGTFSFEVVLNDGETVDNYQFAAYSYEVWPPASTNFAPSVDTAATCNDVGNITLDDGLSCRIEGSYFENDTTNPLAGIWVDAWSSDYSFWNWAETDGTGKFSMKAKCNTSITVNAWNESTLVNVNGRLAVGEKSDNSSKVVLTDVIKANQAPEAQLWVWPEGTAEVGEEVWIEGWGYDAEGDYPITYALSITDGAGSEVYTTTDSWITWTPMVEGAYTLSLTATDSFGNSATTSETLTVALAANNPPVIWWTYVESDYAACGAPILYADAYDPDGAVVEFSWADAGGNPITGTGDPTFDGFVPDAPVSGIVTLSVTDGVDVVTQSLYVPEAGGLTLEYAEFWPEVPTAGTSVELYAWVDGADFGSYAWSVTGPDGVSQYAVSTYDPTDTSYVSFIPDMAGIYSVTLNASSSCGSAGTTFPLTVGDFVCQAPEMWYADYYSPTLSANEDVELYVWADFAQMDDYSFTVTDENDVAMTVTYPYSGDSSYALFTPPADGVYTVTAAVDNGCGTDSIVFDLVIGIQVPTGDTTVILQ